MRILADVIAATADARHSTPAQIDYAPRRRRERCRSAHDARLRGDPPRDETPAAVVYAESGSTGADWADTFL